MAQILDGKKVAAEITEETLKKTEALKQKGIEPVPVSYTHLTAIFSACKWTSEL